MSTAAQWAGVLGGAGGSPFTLRFDRLGLNAQCRPLNAGEVEECVRMGGERGLRYALYLACDDLREAGESLKKQGAVLSAFDITEKLSYGDVLAAGAAILGRSGADTAAVRLEGGREQTGGQEGVPGEELLETERELLQAAGEAGPYGSLRRSGAAALIQGGLDPWDLADRLWAAAGNR